MKKLLTVILILIIVYHIYKNPSRENLNNIRHLDIISRLFTNPNEKDENEKDENLNKKDANKLIDHTKI